MALKKEFKIGIFVILVLVATFVVINILRGTDIFGKTITVSGRFNDIESLVESAPVQIRGYAAGRVDKVEYDPEQDNFNVECSIDKRFKIPADSRMTLYSTSIMGGKGIRIDFGTSKELAGNGSVLEVASDSDLMSSLAEGITPVLSKVNGLIDSLSTTVQGLNDILNDENKTNIAKAIAHLENTLKSASELGSVLGGKSEEFNNIVDNLNKLSEQLMPISESIRKTMENADSITSRIASSDLEKTVGDIDNAIKDINGLVDNLNEPLTKIITDADSLLNEIKKSPKKYLKVTVF